MCLLQQSQVSGIPTSVWTNILFFNPSLLRKSDSLRLPGSNSKFTVWHWPWLTLMLSLPSHRRPLSTCFLKCKPGYQQPDGKVMKTFLMQGLTFSRPSRNDHSLSFPLILLFSDPLSLLVTMATFPDGPIYLHAPPIIKVSWHPVVLLPLYCLSFLSDTEGPTEKNGPTVDSLAWDTWIREIMKKGKMTEMTKSSMFMIEKLF